jgi:hypothetical protein
LVILVVVVVPGLRSLRPLIWFAGVGLVWLVFTFAIYGDVLPQSFHAKVGKVPFAEYLGASLARFVGTGLPALSEFSPGFRPAASVLSVWLIASLKLVPMLGLAAGRLQSRVLLVAAFVVYPILAQLVYAAIGPPKEHIWELQSAYFFFALATFVGVGALAGRLATRRGVALASLVVLVAALGIQATSSWKLLREQETAYWRGARLNTYRRIAHWLDASDARPTTLLTREPGTIRFLLQRDDIVVVDLEGLNWKGDPARGCLERCLGLIPGRQRAPRGDAEFSFVPIQYFPNLDGFVAMTLLERRQVAAPTPGSRVRAAPPRQLR